MSIRSRLRVAALLFVTVAIGVIAKPASGQSKPIVTGGGSTWVQIAIDQWRADVSRYGLRINYQGVGSSSGRQLFIQGNVDFAATEIPFEGQELDAVRAAGRQFAYLPDVAGGTSFMYNLQSGGQPITTLHLSHRTVTGIFTGELRNWNDPLIKADNPGLNLPDEPIKPVVRSDGSGTSAQFSAYMSATEHDRWCNFMKAQGFSDCPDHTSDYPQFGGSVAQSGSDGVANYVNGTSTGDGAITYVETGYALQRGRPVAFMQNASGNYVLPTSNNVTVALRAATLYADKTQNLSAVYTNSDPVAYPVSSYSYMVVPTSGLDPAKGDVLGQFMLYFACDGQRKADQLGYAPLPRNLVQVVFDAERQVPGAPAPPDISQCNNPTITGGGGTSNQTAAALSGGQSKTGSAPPTPGGGASGVAGGGGTAASTAAGGSAGGGSAAGGAAGSELGASGGGAAGSTAGVGGAYGGVAGTSGAGTLSPQALAVLNDRATKSSSTTMAVSALFVLLLVLVPPAWGTFRPHRKPGG